MSTTFGYLERPYLSDPYLTGYQLTTGGMQVTAVINSAAWTGNQVKAQIVASAPRGVQVKAIASKRSPIAAQVMGQINTAGWTGVQVKAAIASAKTIGAQVKAIATGLSPVGLQLQLPTKTSASTGLQTRAFINYARPLGVQVKGINPGLKYTGGQAKASHNMSFWDINGYLVQPYLTGPYLAEWYAGQGGVQVNTIINALKPLGLQVLQGVYQQKPYGIQLKAIINTVKTYGTQVMRQINAKKPLGLQVKGTIKTVTALGFQVYPFVHVDKPIGMQVSLVQGKTIGIQATLVIYNTINLRILSSFPSRGNGSNWTASSTQAGDFSANLLNTDIVEQQWRSALGSTVSVTLDCDTGVSQVFIDTLAILNHNLTTSAVVVLEGSNSADHSAVGVSIPLTVTKGNIIYVAPMLPMQGYRYWRFVINDPTNTDNQIKIGTIVFGAAQIFQGNNITDNVRLTKKHFADSVPTEGFSDVMNDRSLKRAVEIQLQNLDFGDGNYQALEGLFDFARTSLKCLWIPDPAVPTRFGVFGKLAQIPDEDHNNKGVEADYITMQIRVDESL